MRSIGAETVFLRYSGDGLEFEIECEEGVHGGLSIGVDRNGSLQQLPGPQILRIAENIEQAMRASHIPLQIVWNHHVIGSVNLMASKPGER
ncbi:hypothetical protein [Terriglobus sp.]|uniref:hypothetical protein n=1 Tax=Terriglobus sp. TaxID=1889013 RepID=UPI003AFFC1B9